MEDEEEKIEDEEEYLAMGRDGRPYTAVRKRLGMKGEDQKKPAADAKKKEDFFLVWQIRQGVVVEEEEEEGDMVEYLAKREDGSTTSD